METQGILQTTERGGTNINPQTFQVICPQTGLDYPNLSALGPNTFGQNPVAYAAEQSARNATLIAARLIKNIHLANLKKLTKTNCFFQTANQAAMMPNSFNAKM
jgi:hypothetical protein